MTLSSLVDKRNRKFRRAWGGAATPAQNVPAVADGDKGDIVVSGTGAVWTLDAAITATINRKAGYTGSELGTVTQLTSKSTGVTLNKLAGRITTNNASVAAGSVTTFTLTNSQIAVGDVICLSYSGGTAGLYVLFASAVAAGSCSISIRNPAATAFGEAIVINFAVIKAS